MPRRRETPPAMQGLFRRANEVTEQRTRIYWDTDALKAFESGIEIRQERREKGGIKQMVKIGGNGTGDDAMMDRMEYPCRCDAFGVCFEEIDNKPVRKKLMKQFEGELFKPVIAMVSQRARLKYHPEGNTDVLIEAAFDYPCWGFAFSGFIWKAPEMELEIVDGPDDHAAAFALLERETRRFEERFELTRMATSKPTPGFEQLGAYLASDEGQNAFRRLSIETPWWLSPTLRTDFVATNPVAKLAKTG